MILDDGLVQEKPEYFRNPFFTKNNIYIYSFIMFHLNYPHPSKQLGELSEYTNCAQPQSSLALQFEGSETRFTSENHGLRCKFGKGAAHETWESCASNRDLSVHGADHQP